MHALLVAVVLATSGFAAAEPAGRSSFRSFGSEQGLENLAINDLAQTSDGRIWVATEDGLYAFDGAQFERFDARNGLPSSSVIRLHPAGETLWIGTERGLARYRKGTFENLTVTAGLPATQVNDLEVASDGSVWAATDVGLYHQQGVQFLRVGDGRDGIFGAVWVSRTGRVVAGRGTEVVTTTDGVTWHVLAHDAGFGIGRVETIEQTADGVVWLRSAHHLWQCDAALATCADIQDQLPDVADEGRLMVDHAGTLWVSTRSGLAHRLSDGTWQVLGRNEGMATRSVSVALEDKEGTLWVAADQLYQQLGRGMWRTHGVESGFPGDIAWFMHRDRRGTLWVGTNRGLIEATRDGWRVFAGTERYSIKTIAEVGADLYIAGSESVLMKVDPTTRTLTTLGPGPGLEPTQITSIVEHGNTLWVGTWNLGLLTMTWVDGQPVWRREPLPGGSQLEDVNELLVDRHDRLWVAGSDGLAMLDHGQWRRWTQHDGLADASVAYIVERRSGELCTAYLSAHGVTCFRYDGELRGVRHLTRDGGLTSDMIYLLGEDTRGRLYVGTGLGVDLVVDDTSPSMTIEHFSTRTGLAGDDCAARAFLADADGTVWIGSTRGVSVFQSALYHGPIAPTPPVVIAVTLDGVRLAPTDRVQAPRDGAATLELRFATPTFANRTRLEQQVRLLPGEPEWRTTSSNEAHFARLAPGTHTFEVRTRSAPGAYGPVSTLTIVVPPAWWQTTWFRTVWILSLVIACAAAVVWVTRRFTRRAARLIVQRSEASLHALIEQSPDAVLVHRGEVIIYVNARTVVLLGYAHATDLIGRPVSAVIPTRELLVADRTEVREIQMLRHDGTSVTFEVSSLGVEFGGSPAVLVIARDVSAKKALEARLMTSDRMASIGTLAAGVAHEVNNPLAYVKTNLELMDEELGELAGNARIRAALADALEGTARVESIISGLRSFSRVNHEQRVSVDLAAAVNRALRMTNNELRHRCRVVTEIGPVPRVLGDESRLGQVFINLLVNAAHAIPEDACNEHEVRVTARTDSEGRAVIEVRDTGCGMPPEIARRIFEPFFTTKEIGRGTGLGLAIVHGIVESHGGTISVDTSPGRGSRFQIILPAAVSDAMAQGTESATELALTAPEPSAAYGGGEAAAARKSMLVVDDDDRLRESVGRMLAKDYDVTLAASGTEALAVFASGQRFDLVLCDLMMPGATGIEVYEHLAAHYPALAARTLFMTGGAFTNAAQQFLVQADVRWIEKPFVMRDLRARIAQMIERNTGPMAAAAL